LFSLDMVLLLTQPLEVELRAGYQGHSFSRFIPKSYTFHDTEMV